MNHDILKPEEIFKTFYSKIFSFTFLRVCNIHDAEDIASNVFVKVVEKLDTYKPEKAALSTWIFTIALNEIRMFYRKRKSLYSLNDMNEVVYQMDIEDNLLKHEERALLIKAIDGLEDRRKKILLLKYFGDLTDRQIAGILKLSEKNIGVILTRTRKDLRAKSFANMRSVHS